MPTTPPRSNVPVTARPVRGIAVASITALIGAGMVVIPMTVAPAAAAVSDHETFLVSQTASGISSEAAITPDGQHVAFTSTASLFADDTNGVSDVFLASAADGDDPFSGDPVLISAPDASMPQVPANGRSSHPIASADGRYVAFLSAATNLTEDDYAPQAWTNVFVRDTVLETTIRIEGQYGEPLGNATSVDMSDDGRYIAFVSAADNFLPVDPISGAPLDNNGALDGFIADLDHNGDGTRGDIIVDHALGYPPTRGVTELAISGNGARIAFTAHYALNPTEPVDRDDYLYVADRDNAGAGFVLVAEDGHSLTINSNGDVVAYVSDSDCGPPTVIAATFGQGLYFDDPQRIYYVGVGTRNVDTTLGTVAHPAVSADGSTVAWETTQPLIEFPITDDPRFVLPQPVVRTQRIAWRDATTGLTCESMESIRQEIAVGQSPSLSASGRTVSFSGPTTLSTAPAAVLAVDTHWHEGLSVASTQGELSHSGFMTAVDVAGIPVSAIRGYASALANAPIHRIPIHRIPIHRIPIHRIPIHRIPIHRIPIHRIPIHRIDIPGGWTELLIGTPFENQAPQTIIFGDVMEWAEQNAPDDSPAEAPERAAAKRILLLTLDDIDLDNSGIDALTLASLVLGNAKLSQVHIAGADADTDTQRWQDVVDAQALVDDLGVPVTISAETVLAELDFAGLDVSQTGVEAVGLASLPISDTLLDTMPARSLNLHGTPIGDLLVSQLSDTAVTALFGGPLSGTITENLDALTDEATAADLARGVPSSITVGDLLFTLVDGSAFPWEQIDPASMNPATAAREAPSYGCDGQKRCGRTALYTFTFDRGPGDSAPFIAPMASISLPAGTVPTYAILASASGPSTSLYRAEYNGPHQVDGNLVRLPLADAVGGTSISFEVAYSTTTQPGASSAMGTLTSGDLTASLRMAAYYNPDFLDDPANNRVGTDWQDGELDREPLLPDRIYYEWLSAGPSSFNEFDGTITPGPALDEDYFLVNAPLPGQRLVISTNATDGQIALALFASSATQTQLVEAASTPVPGTAVTEQNGDAWAPAESGADAAAPLAEHTLVDQAAVGGGGSAQLEAASTDAAPETQMLLRVTSADGTATSSLYSLRAQYLEEPAEITCASWVPPQTIEPAEIGTIGTSDAVEASTNTLYLFDQKRFGDTHGATAAASVRAALETLTGEGKVGSGHVEGAVLSVDEDQQVQDARAAVDDNPCSMSARRGLTAAVNAFVAERLRAVEDEHITSVVIVGGDDILPFAPVAQHTAQFNEASHSADLRRSTTPDGRSCPDEVPAAPDPDLCATPLSAAAATNYILTDDPYGLASAYESLGGHLYVPTVGVGRLIDSPEQILAAIDRFIEAEGILQADSSLTGGYGAWAELPGIVTDTLDWRTSSEARLEDAAGEWDKFDVEAALFPAGGQSAKVVSMNTHADETRLLPGLRGADAGLFDDDDLLHAGTYVDSPQLAGSLVFMIGCHAGGNLPTAYYGDVADWADVFSSAGGFVGNTGYGLANNVSTALGERLMALYADWIGVWADEKPVSAAEALTYAKQSYLGGLGLYSGYDEKVLMEAVYYGLPMYTFANELKPAPLPQAPELLAVDAPADDLIAAGLTLTPRFEEKQATDDAGRTVSYLAAAASDAPTAVLQDPLAVPGQPILPRVVSRLVVDDLPEGMVPRGALITRLASDVTDIDNPATAQANIGVSEPTPSRTNVAFPSTFATVTQQLTPSGPIDLLVVTPGRVEAAAPGTGVVEQFTTMDLQVVYADASNPDITAPLIRSVDAPSADTSYFTVYADDSESDIARMLLLVQTAGSKDWVPYDMTPSGSTWVANTGYGPLRWILQAVDTAGNVAIETGRGHLPTAGSPAPTLGDPGGAAALKVGDRLVRSIVVDGAAPGEHITASFEIIQAGDRPGREQTVASGPVLVTTGSDGVSRAALDHVVNMAGVFTVEVEVCQARSCTTASFPLEAGLVNTAPTATVALSSSTAGNWTTSTLTAAGGGADADGDAVTLSYAWTRNGVALENPGPDASVLALPGVASAGDEIGVIVTPSDGQVDGHAASARVLVKEAPEPPVLPEITATAMVGSAVYDPEDWSKDPVTVTFECTSGLPLMVLCPGPVVVSADTPLAGTPVTGEIRDIAGNLATVTFVVKYDHTAPTVTAVVTPSTVPVGGPAPTVTPTAVDPSSGVDLATVSCDVPQTTTAGPASVLCHATDVAGNTGEGAGHYTVQAPPPAPTCRGVLDRTALPPLNADGSSVFLRTSGVPVVFAACDRYGNPVTTKKFVTGVTLTGTANLPARTLVNELWYPPVQAFSYVKPLNVWAGNISTAKLAGGKKYTYRVDLSDGTSFTVTFGVR